MAEHPDFSREGPGFESLQTDQEAERLPAFAGAASLFVREAARLLFCLDRMKRDSVS